MLDAKAEPAPVESAENEYGVLIDIERLALAGKPLGARHGGRLPDLTSISIAHADGRWHWGISVYTGTFGFGFSPSRKWRRSAATRQCAIIDAAFEIRERIAGRHGKDVRSIEHWLDRVLAGDAQQVAA